MRLSDSWSLFSVRRPVAHLLPIVGVLLLALAGCSSDDAPSDRDVLISLTDEVVFPAYESLARDMTQLDRDVNALCNAPDEASLKTARQSWRNARASRMRSEAMWFGPVMDRRSIRLLDWSPTDVDGIDEMLVEGRVLSVDEVREVLASNLRGFGAIEYVLFGSGAFANPNAPESQCRYLAAMTKVARGETDAILSEWLNATERRPPYKDFFSDRASSAILPRSAVAEVVRTQVFLIRDAVDMRLATAMGLRGDAPDLSAVPGTAADNGLQDLRNEILGMQAIYEGKGEDGLGISDLVRALSVDTDRRLLDQFVAAISAIDAVEGSLRAAITDRPDQVRSVHESLQNVQITISTEVVSLLGVSVGFTDTDGDSQR